ncbi:MAG: hypothetical protein A2X36_01685 [Elusimicrobia bacterium GWA2_69_24]|nr:MAG: hypothetical protein A2X36_01685 [Elusimicrobia bacterium GWA2_69_24]HBL19128.1 hypothetical protein [Elusimicrobiota bacterium]
MRAARWWPASATLVYLCLAAFTWMFSQEGLQAAPRLQPKSMDESFAPMRLRGSRPGGGREGGGPKVPFSRIVPDEDGYSLSFGFKNFNGDVLTLQAALPAGAVAESVREFGFSGEQFEALDKWYKKAQQTAVAEANERFVSGQVTAKSKPELASKMAFIREHNDGVQKQLDAQLAQLSEDYRRKRIEVYTKGGFRFQAPGKNVVEADIPAMVRRNWKRVRGVAQGFAGLAEEQGYESEDLVGAVTAMVQTSMRYEVPADREGNRVMGGVLPPPKSLSMGQGDCDTKTAVIASILMNWPNLKMVGLAIPGHYLMAVHRIPRNGDVFIEYEGIPYVMIESAGPAWLPPGEVGETTSDYLGAGNNFRIQPLTL